MLSAFLACLADMFTESACWCWRLGKREVGAGRLGWTRAKGGCNLCSVIALGENMESGYGGTERVEDVHGQPTWFYDRHGLHFSSFLNYLEQNIC